MKFSLKTTFIFLISLSLIGCKKSQTTECEHSSNFDNDTYKVYSLDGYQGNEKFLLGTIFCNKSSYTFSLNKMNSDDPDALIFAQYGKLDVVSTCGSIQIQPSNEGVWYNMYINKTNVSSKDLNGNGVVGTEDGGIHIKDYNDIVNYEIGYTDPNSLSYKYIKFIKVW
ncbi:MAG: hypothetical protein U0V72_09150 [Cytophagales bacterium]